MNVIGNAGVGRSLDRVDGTLKVSGRATYAAEFTAPGMVHAVMVQSTVAAGSIAGFDVARAQAMPGVLAIITPDNAARLTPTKAVQQTVVKPLLQDHAVFYNGQNIAVVVADTLERAQAAAACVQVRYTTKPATPVMPDTFATGGASGSHAPRDFQGGRAEPTSSRGTPQQSFDAATQKIDVVYTTPVEHHNPMEPHATLAAWDNTKLTVWSSTQGINGTRQTLAAMFDIPLDSVLVICPYVGGGFGCKGNTWPPAVLAAMAARQVGRPVKLTLSRREMYTSNGFRPRTVQRVRLAATQDGTLSAVMHEGVSQMSDSSLGEYVEPVALATRMLYACDNVATSHTLLRVDAGLPTYMRGPGEAPGIFALDCAMDELATKLGMDPLELRLKNYADTDRDEGKPFSAKNLRACYMRGAELFGWSRRPSAPRAMRDGRVLIGWGMATATYPAVRQPASAKVRLNADGSVVVGCATQDLGTGTYTVMTQVVAEAFGVPAERVTALLGDSRLPRAPVSGGSMTVASITPAILKACEAVRQAVFKLAADDAKVSVSPDWQLSGGVVTRSGGGTQPLAALLGRVGQPYVEATAQTDRGDGGASHSLHSFGAQFAEVRVDQDLGEIRVSRYVGVFDAGRIVNPKTAHSQLLGAVTAGIGMALMEATETDPHTGRIVNANLSEYLVPVHPDIPKLQVEFVDGTDPFIGPLGARGIGELPMVGVAPAIANAVYHATGLRVRTLPIRLEDVLTVPA